jgi:hypothetical protein
LAGVVLAMFICNPEYLVANRVFQREYLYRNYEWVSSEQLFWLAVKDLPGLLHWPYPPFDGWYKDKVTSIRIQDVMKPRYNSIFEETEDYNSLPYVDISSLLLEQKSEAPGSTVLRQKP